MPVIPQYQQRQELAPMSGARFRAPEVPDLVGPALQNMAHKLSQAATVQEQVAARDAEREAKERMTRYEAGETAVMYGVPGQTPGFLSLRGKDALDAQAETAERLAQLRAEVLTDADPRVAELLGPALDTRATATERRLAAYGLEQGQIAADGAVEARIEVATASATAKAADPEAYNLEILNIKQEAQALAARRGLSGDAANLYVNKTVAAAHLRAGVAMVAQGRMQEAAAFVATHGAELDVLGGAAIELREQVRIGMASVEGEQLARGAIAAATVDGVTNYGQAMATLQEIGDPRTRKASLDFTEQHRQIAQVAETDDGNTARREALALIQGGKRPDQLPPALQLRLGPAGMNAVQSFYTDVNAAGADIQDGSDAYLRARDLYRTNRPAFIASLSGDGLMRAARSMSSGDLNRLLGMADTAANGSGQSDPVDTAMTRTMGILGPQLGAYGVQNAGATATAYDTAQVAARRHLEGIARAGGPNYTFTPRDIDEAVNAGFRATAAKPVKGVGVAPGTPAPRGDVIGDVTAEAVSIMAAADIPVTPVLGAAAARLAQETGGQAVVPFDAIPAANRQALIAAAKRAGVPSPTRRQIEIAFTRAMRQQLEAAQ